MTYVMEFQFEGSTLDQLITALCTLPVQMVIGLLWVVSARRMMQYFKSWFEAVDTMRSQVAKNEPYELAIRALIEKAKKVARTIDVAKGETE